MWGKSKSKCQVVGFPTVMLVIMTCEGCSWCHYEVTVAQKYWDIVQRGEEIQRNPRTSRGQGTISLKYKESAPVFNILLSCITLKHFSNIKNGVQCDI